MSDFLRGLVMRAAGSGAFPQVQPRHEPRFLPGDSEPAAAPALSEEDQPPAPPPARTPPPGDAEPSQAPPPRSRAMRAESPEASPAKASPESVWAGLGGPQEREPDAPNLPKITTAAPPVARDRGVPDSRAAGREQAARAPVPASFSVNHPTASVKRATVPGPREAPAERAQPHDAAPAPAVDAEQVGMLPVAIRPNPAPPPRAPKSQRRIDVHIGRVELRASRPAQPPARVAPARSGQPSMPRGFENVAVARRYLDRIVR